MTSTRRCRREQQIDARGAFPFQRSIAFIRTQPHSTDTP
jgi:hypothetical protein